MKVKIQTAIRLTTACLPAIIYVTWLAACYWLLEAGRFKAFIQPKLWPLLILTLILLLLYIAAFISHFTLESGGILKFERWLQAAILFVPVVFLWAVYGQSLGAHALAKRALNTNQPFSVSGIGLQRASPKTDQKTVSLLEILENADHLNGKRVAADGMVYSGGHNSDRSRFRIFRFVVVCCAADALPLVIWVKSKIAEKYNNDDWVRVEGVFSFETLNGRQVASIAADSVRPIPAPPPEKRYLFF